MHALFRSFMSLRPIGAFFSLSFPTTTLLHFITSHWLCSSSHLLYYICCLFYFIFFHPEWWSSSVHYMEDSHVILGVQSHYFFSVWHSKPPSLLSFGVQSHHIFSVWNSKLSVHSLAFRATIPSQFGIKSHLLFSLAFRTTIYSQFGIQSHHLLIGRHSESYLQFGI